MSRKFCVSQHNRPRSISQLHIYRASKRAIHEIRLQGIMASTTTAFQFTPFTILPTINKIRRSNSNPKHKFDDRLNCRFMITHYRPSKVASSCCSHLVSARYVLNCVQPPKGHIEPKELYQL